MKKTPADLINLPFWRIAVELFKRGNYTLQCETPFIVDGKKAVHEKQMLAFQLLMSGVVTRLGYGGSGRSGKSWFEGEALLMLCLAFAGTRWGLARKELKLLRRTTFVTVLKVFRKYGIKKDVHYRYNQNDHIVTFFNGSQILLIDTAYSPEDPLYTRFGGLELTGCFIDESNESPWDAIDILGSRVGWCMNIEYNLPAIIAECFNPDKGHVYNRYYAPYRDGVEEPHSRFIKALPGDNPDPAVKVWIENMEKNGSETAIRRLVHGDFDYDSSLDKLINHNAINDYFKNQHVEARGLKYITADIARMGADATIIRVWHGLRVLERHVLNRTKVNETAAYIRDLANKYQVPMSRVIVDEDGVGGGVCDMLDCYGFVAAARTIGKTNYQNLKTQCYFVMADLINNAKVYEDCSDQNVIAKIKQEMDWVRQRNIDDDQKLKVVQKDDIKKALRRSPDDWECIMMRAFFELGNEA